MNPVYLLDTNVVSEFSKSKPNMKVLEAYDAYRDVSAISSITWQEIIKGISRLPDSHKKTNLMDFAENLRENMPIIDYDAFSAQICGEVQSKCESAGKTLQYYDAQIAATALSHGMILVTHNTKDFQPFKENSSLNLVDWA